MSDFLFSPKQPKADIYLLGVGPFYIVVRHENDDTITRGIVVVVTSPCAQFNIIYFVWVNNRLFY